MHIPSTLSYLRVTASFLGQRNYTRFEIEAIVGERLAQQLGLIFVNSEDRDTDEALWCRVHLIMIGANPWFKDTPIGQALKQSWAECHCDINALKC